MAACNHDNFQINPITISCPDPYDFRSHSPLGELKVSVGKEVQMDNLSPISPTLKDAIRPSYRYENLSKKLMKEVKKVLGFGESLKYSLHGFIRTSRLKFGVIFFQKN